MSVDEIFVADIYIYMFEQKKYIYYNDHNNLSQSTYNKQTS